MAILCPPAKGAKSRPLFDPILLKDPGFGREFIRLLADPIKSLFFQKIAKGEMDGELNEKLYRLVTGGG